MPGVSRRGDMNGYQDFENGHLRTSSYVANGYDPYRADISEYDTQRELRYDPPLTGRSTQLGLTARSDYNPRSDYFPGSARPDPVGSGYAQSVRDDYGGPSNRNLVQQDYDQNSMDDELKYEVHHLATYTTKSGITSPEDGLTKLKHMENSSGIWTMRCIFIIEKRHLVVIDKGSGDELERFPLVNVHEPVAVMKNDRREVYNNLVLFTVLEDPRRKNTPSDMHIFQCIDSPAHEIVDRILKIIKPDSGDRAPKGKSIPPRPSGPAPEPPYMGKLNETRLRDTRMEERHILEQLDEAYNDSGTDMNRLGDTRPGPSRLGVSGRYNDTRIEETQRQTRYGESSRFNDGRYGNAGRDMRASYIQHSEMDTGQNEALERDVQLLNNCFDDIEKFVARLQQAAEAYKELEHRRNERGGKNKRRSQGEGMLHMRARPPPIEDFIDIFQKFKYAFNLLAKLKAHIHDPNAPELVHFLFTPLSLIYEASRDSSYRGEDIAGHVVAPLLSQETKQLLLNCLSSRELELYQHLGKPWTLTAEEWKGEVPPKYNPRFYNGWQPSPTLVDPVPLSPRDREPREQREPREPREQREPRDDYIRPPAPVSPYGRSGYMDEPEDPYSRREPPFRREDRIDTSIYQKQIPAPPPEPIRVQPSRQEENHKFMQELKRTHAVIYEAVHERQGKNTKELTIEKGDILQVLDKSRNWWKLKNFKGEIGYAPFTILKEYAYDSTPDINRLSGDYSSYISNKPIPPPAPAPPPMNGSSRGGRDQPRPREEQQKSAPPTQQKPQYHRDSLYSAGLQDELRLKFTDHSPKADRRSGSDTKWSTGPIYLPTSSSTPESRSPTGNSNNRWPSSNPQDQSPRAQSSPRTSPRQPSPRQPSPPVNRKPERRVLHITQESSEMEVKDWLATKGFSQRCMTLLEGYIGLDLFDLERTELERLLGKEEGWHLDSLLNVQKSSSGFKTRSTAELRAILQRRKERADTQSSEEAHMGKMPNFTPDTPPDYSSDEEDASSEDDFGDAGKTLRQLLNRQRKKIQSGQYRQYEPKQLI